MILLLHPAQLFGHGKGDNEPQAREEDNTGSFPPTGDTGAGIQWLFAFWKMSDFHRYVWAFIPPDH